MMAPLKQIRHGNGVKSNRHGFNHDPVPDGVFGNAIANGLLALQNFVAHRLGIH